MSSRRARSPRRRRTSRSATVGCRNSMSSPARILIAAAVGLALADASVVTLALPEILVELDTTVEGVAAVLGVYTLVLAVALPPAEWLRRRIGTARLAVAGLAAFAPGGGGGGGGRPFCPPP